MSDPSSQPTQPLTDEELAEIVRRFHSDLVTYSSIVKEDVPRLLDEVSRLRAENTAQSAKIAELPDLDTIRRIEKERGSWGMQLSEARRERDDLAVRLSARTVIKETISELEDQREALAAKLDAVNRLRYDDEGNQFEHIPGYCGPGCAGCWSESIGRALGLDQDGNGQA